jgi:electron transfer flavoprotein alpha subunit
VLAGRPDSSVLKQLAENGAQRAFGVEDDGASPPPLPAPHTEVVLAAYRGENYDAVLLAGSVLAMDVAGRLSAQLEAGVNWDLTAVSIVDGDLVGVRPVFGDSLLVDVGWTTTARVAVFRPGALAPEGAGQTGSALELESLNTTGGDETDVVLESAGGGAGAGADAQLAKAKVIVSAGRGIGSRDNLQLVRDLADALGGVPGVSLPLVSAGWAPYSMQVGQTGTIVRPDLYIACGISGQVQHRTGMQFAKTIVAINTDENAPIASFCDLFVEADVLKVVPELTRLIRGDG